MAKIAAIKESDLSPFEKWWRTFTIEMDRSFSSAERLVAMAAFDAGARLGDPNSSAFQGRH